MTTVTRSPGRRARARWASVGRHALIIGLCLIWMVPLYLVVVNAFKPQEEILGDPFGIPLAKFTGEYLVAAITSPDFNVVGAYGISALLVVVNIVLVALICGPVAYVIARSTRRIGNVLLFFFMLGLFIPGQVTLIHAVHILKGIGLLHTMPGLVLFQVTLCIPMTLFLYVAYIRTISPTLDEAASLDGAGRFRIFWTIVFPLMRPVVATTVILNGIGIWNDFVSPQILLDPLSDVDTVTTGIYAALGQFNSFFTTVYPNLLLVIGPALAFFVLMQRHIVAGLTAGATKQ